MKYLLDSNTCIRLLNGRSPNVLAQFLKVADIDIALCSIVKAEMFTGAAKSQFPKQTMAKQTSFFSRFVSLPFDDDATEPYARLRGYLEKQGKPIGGNDMLIAAIALTYDLILVTHNTAEFSRIPGLKLEDWET